MIFLPFKHFPLNEEIMFDGDLLFHGTSANFEPENIRPGGYDKILWSATSPGVAQSYIPSSGSSVGIMPPAKDSKLGVNPAHHDPLTQIAIQMGYQVHTFAEKHVPSGILTSGKWVGGAIPTEGQISRYIEEELGYNVNRYTPLNLKLGSKRCATTKSNIVMPNDYKQPGRLFILQVIHRH